MNTIPQDIHHKQAHASAQKDVRNTSAPKKQFPASRASAQNAGAKTALNNELLEETLAEAMQDALKKAKAADDLSCLGADGDPEESGTDLEDTTLSCAPIETPRLFHTSISPTLPSVPLVTEISPLFEKMVSAISVLMDKGKTETTVTLTNPASIFCGGKIVIQEFSTAPKAFNVQIIASPEAIALCQKHGADLMNFFDKHAERFKIHTIETHLLTEKRPLVEKVESISDEDA